LVYVFILADIKHEEKNEEIKRITEENKKKDEEIKTIKDEIKRKDEEIKTVKDEIKRKDEEMKRKDKEMKRVIEEKDEEIKRKDEEIKRKEEEINKKNSELKKYLERDENLKKEIYKISKTAWPDFVGEGFEFESGVLGLNRDCYLSIVKILDSSILRKV
jgi:predicted RNase H-like nuclease (RuvC/YqgF family)